MGIAEYKPQDFLTECLDYQAALSQIRDPASQDELGRQFCGLLFGKAEHHGAQKIFIRAGLAYVFAEAAQFVEPKSREGTKAAAALEFRDLLAKARIGNPEYVRPKKADGTIAWTLYDAEVGQIAALSPEQAMDELDEDVTLMMNRMPVDRPLRRPVHVPVQFIDAVLCASPQDPYRHSERVEQKHAFGLVGWDAMSAALGEIL